MSDIETIVKSGNPADRVTIRTVSIASIRELRSALLRPFERPDELVYCGDDAADTLHAGVFLGDELIGIASVCRDPSPGDSDTNSWRLRGVAIQPELRGRGYGRQLLAACIEHARQRDGKVLWCYGRTSAAGFYEAAGFVPVGPDFEVPGTGPHNQFRLLLVRPDTDATISSHIS